MEKIPRIEVNGARVPLIESPIVDRIPPPVVNRPMVPGLDIPKPVVDVPRPSVNYPTILVPSSVPAPAPQRPTEPQKASDAPQRNLPSTPQVQSPPVVQTPSPQPLIPVKEPAEVQTVVEIAGNKIDIPTPQEVAQASVTAVIGTSVTLATAMVFGQARRVMGDAVAKAVRDKFRIKLKAVKPVIHMIEEEDGVTVMEYSGEGVRTLATQVTNPEQYLRDTIETDELYESDHKIIIDEPIRSRFTREGAKRFNYFAPPQKLARRLAARIALG